MSLNINKIIFVLLLAILVIPVNAQQGLRATDAIEVITGKKVSTFPDLVAKPSFEATNGGFRYKVWIMSVIKGMKDGEVKNTETDTDDVQKGTHHILIEVNDPESGSSISDAMVKVLSVSPSGKESALDLDPMMAQYGGNINFDEKGDYLLNVTVNTGGRSTLTPFRYTVN